MKKYIIAFLVLCLIEGLAGWRNAAQPKEPQSRVVTAIEIQTADGPAYLVCMETADDTPQLTQSAGQMNNPSNADTGFKPASVERASQISSFNLFPEPVTVALLAFCGYLLGGRR